MQHRAVSHLPAWTVALPVSCLLHLLVGLWMALPAGKAPHPPAQAPLRLHLQQTSLSTPDTATLARPATGTNASASSATKSQPEAQRWLNGLAYYPAATLDAPVVPVSAPDLSRLQHVVFTGEAIRLRLWINAQGRVSRIDTLDASPQDANTVDTLRAMLFDTAYIPARRQGLPVAVVLDMELDFGQPKPRPLERRTLS